MWDWLWGKNSIQVDDVNREVIEWFKFIKKLKKYLKITKFLQKPNSHKHVIEKFWLQKFNAKTTLENVPKNKIQEIRVSTKQI